MVSKVCFTSHGAGSDSNCLCPTPDSILVTSPLPQVRALEVLPHFLASWGLASVLGLCEGTRNPTVPPFTSLGVSKLPAL